MKVKINAIILMSTPSFLIVFLVMTQCKENMHAMNQYNDHILPWRRPDPQSPEQARDHP